MSALIDKLVPEAVPVDEGGFALLRRKAQKVLMQNGFPHRKTENWKYMPLALLEKRSFRHAPAVPDQWPEAPSLPFDAAVVQIHNGIVDPARSRLPEGVSLTRLEPDDVDISALDEHSPADAFAWLNIARLDKGWRLAVDGAVDRPLVLATSFDNDFDAAVHPRIRLDLARGAELTLIELQAGHGQGLSNAVLDIGLAPNARLEHLIERAGDETALIERTTVDVGEDADYRAWVLDGGGPLTRQDLAVNLLDRGARGRIHGVALLSDRALVDYHTSIEHRVGATESEEMFRILADDLACGVFNGRIHIVRGADDSHSEMTTGNLLLSENARINTKPELEIHAEDVTASHGATVGQLDDDARFYLRSRGLTDREAITLLKFGFAAAVFDALPAGKVRDWLIERLGERL